jgi:TPR repeat protein
MLYRETHPEAKVFKDNSTAVMWLNRAASKGHTAADIELKKIYAEANSIM